MSRIETEKVGRLSSKFAHSNINGRGNKFKLFAFETVFTKRSATPTNVTVEFNDLRLLLIILDAKYKSISMQNLWAWGGGWLDHTQHVQPVQGFLGKESTYTIVMNEQYNSWVYDLFVKFVYYFNILSHWSYAVSGVATGCSSPHYKECQTHHYIHSQFSYTMQCL